MLNYYMIYLDYFLILYNFFWSILLLLLHHSGDVRLDSLVELIYFVFFIVLNVDILELQMLNDVFQRCLACITIWV